MEQTKNTYEYQGLDTSQKQIRLIELQPGGFLEPMRVSLSRTSLDDNPKYDALSYLWGDPSVTAPITVEHDKHFQVTVNLEKALRDLRQEEQSVILWVDAICINQKNIIERNQQVLLMREIYEKATTTRIWLDRRIDAHSPAFVRFAQLHNNPDTPGPKAWPDEREFWSPIAELCNDPYWNRAWIQQEVMFAQNLVVHCRKDLLDTESFRRHHQQITDTRPRAADIAHALDGITPFPLSQRFTCVRESNIPDQRPAIIPPYSSLILALNDCWRLKATNPRDKIFAMLGLVNDPDRRDIIVDYHLSVREVYRCVVDLALRESPPLEFLTHANLAESNSSLCLPTWLPDWSFPDKSPKEVNESLNLDDSPFSTLKQPAQILENGLTLRVGGFRIDLVHQVSSVLDEYYESGCEVADKNQGQFDDWNQLVDKAATEATPKSCMLGSHASDSHLRNAIRGPNISAKTSNAATNEVSRTYWRALLDTLTWSNQTPDSMGDELIYFFMEVAIQRSLSKPDPHYAIQKELQKMERENEDVEEYHKLGGSILAAKLKMLKGSHVILLTDTSFFALAPRLAQAGDQVWYLHGCPSPMVLRREQEHFIVIGPARIDPEEFQIVKEELKSAAEEGRPMKYQAETIDLH